MGSKYMRDRETISGFVYIDDIKFTDIKKEIGYAGNMQLNYNFADLITGGSVNVNYMNSDFRKDLNQQYGEGKKTLNFNTSATLNLDKFFPDKWKLSFPLKGNYTNNTEKMVYYKNTDVPATEGENRNDRTSYSVSTSLKKNSQSENTFIKHFIDPFSLSAQYCKIRC